jgi:hypothetical protein
MPLVLGDCIPLENCCDHDLSFGNDFSFRSTAMLPMTQKFHHALARTRQNVLDLARPLLGIASIAPFYDFSEAIQGMMHNTRGLEDIGRTKTKKNGSKVKKRGLMVACGEKQSFSKSAIHKPYWLTFVCIHSETVSGV